MGESMHRSPLRTAFSSQQTCGSLDPSTTDFQNQNFGGLISWVQVLKVRVPDVGLKTFVHQEKHRVLSLLLIADCCTRAVIYGQTVSQSLLFTLIWVFSHLLNLQESYSWLWFFFLIFIFYQSVVDLQCVVLVSGVQQSDSVINIHTSIFFRFFSHLGYYRILSRYSLCYIVHPCQ